jgi:hypothetical protein
MMIRNGALIAACAIVSAPALADFSYEQTTRMTGGVMMAALKMAGPFARQAREPQKHSVVLKGDRMATFHGNAATIIDIGKETVTEVDFDKKTYSVITFAELAKAMEAAMRKLADQRSATSADVKFKVDLKSTGRTKTIQGLEASQTILSFETEGTDPKTGQKAAMLMAADMWQAAAVPGYDEVRKFSERMAKKIAWRPGQNLAQAGGPFADMFKGMAEVSTEAGKLEGVPVLQVTRMAPKTEGLTAETLATMPLPPDQTAEAAANMPSASELAKQEATETAAGAAAGRAGRAGAMGGLAGRLGGLGGFGRRKKQQEQEQQKEQAPAAQTQPGSTGQVSVLMEMTTELSAFSPASVDPSRVEVPAGFRQVESELVRQLGR